MAADRACMRAHRGSAPPVAQRSIAGMARVGRMSRDTIDDMRRAVSAPLPIAMRPLIGFVELDRRFSALEPSTFPDDAASHSYLAGALAGADGLDWDKLLQETLVVVLGEPGSGKTWELRQRCAVLQERGENAFFLELERLVAGSVPEAIAAADRDRFRAWQRGGRPAWFFL